MEKQWATERERRIWEGITRTPGVVIRRRDRNRPQEPLQPMIRLEKPIDIRELLGRDALAAELEHSR